jgi:hypothetical protein
MSRTNHREDLRHLAESLRPPQEVRDRAVAVAVDRARRSPRAAPWLVAGGLVAIAAVVVAVVLVGPQRVDRELVAEVEAKAEALSGEMEVEYLGRGAASGLAEDVDIRWDEGTLRAEVRPGRGNRLRVSTPEAEVRVVGTVFEVTRDAVGTSVEVARGEVAVTCAHEEEVRLGAGAARTCYRGPTAALGFLRSPAAATLTHPELIATIDRALALPGGALAAHNELLLLRLTAHYEAGSTEEALVAAEAYLEGGSSHRRLEVLGLASHLAQEHGGCARSRPWLEAWHAEGGQLPVPALVHLADCLASDQVRARALLEEALAAQPDGPDAEAVRARLERL